MTNSWERFGESENENNDNREQIELLENIIDIDQVIKRLNRLLKNQSELFIEEIGALEALLNIIEKYKVIFDPLVDKKETQNLANSEEDSNRVDLPDDENLDNEIYQEIHRRINIGQQILDAEQIIKRCEKLLSSGKIIAEDERKIFPALKILENFKKTLQG